MVTSPEVIAELERIAAQDGAGILKPEAVVDSARQESSPLHSWFEWDDSEAAQKWRIHQARQLIRVTVTYIGAGESRTAMRVFVSLTPDREEEGGGYRATVDVLSSKEHRKQLLADAMAEMKRFEEKYSSLGELIEVFDAIRKAHRKVAA